MPIGDTMRILNKIYKLANEELEQYVRTRINTLEEEFISSRDYNDYIGFNLDINPQYSMYKKNNKVFINNRINYYIPLYTKVIYGMNNLNNNTYNMGYYYYIDDDSYIINFLKYIKDYKIEDDYELFENIYWFIHDYFGKYEIIKREKMHRLILKNNNEFYNLNKEHFLTDFYKKGNALCTEYSLLAHNLLTFLGYDSIYTIILNDNSSHAFNLVSYFDIYENERENMLIDFSIPVYLMNINREIICTNPYIYELDKSIHIVADNLLSGKELLCDNYYLMSFEDGIMKVSSDSKRNYSMSDGKKKSLRR